MENSTPILFLLSLHLLLLLLRNLPTSHAQLLSIIDDHENGAQIYIIDLERHEHHELLNDEDLKSWHASFLPNSTLDSGAPRLVYSYRHVLSGFAARLTLSELEAVKSMQGFLGAEIDQNYQIDTTYTPRYLGVTTNNGWGSTMMGEGIIIGIIDTGIKSTHPSFNDSNMPPAPPETKWKGSCRYSDIPCNNKIIGAKAFDNGLHPSPLDTQGHGTHVASIAAGNFVKNANVLEMANGTASGMAPMAYLSIYKACFPKKGCSGSNILAAADQAIRDGVDIISMSISGGLTATFYQDAVSRASMAAIQRGIVAITSAGNAGPSPATLSHSAPWMLVIGASTTDRRIESIVELGDGRIFLGESAYQPKTWNSTALLSLEYPGINDNVNTRCCVPAYLANLNLKGKIVICETGIVSVVMKEKGAIKAGAEGMIIVNKPNQGYTTFSQAHVIPTAYVDYPARVEIMSYYFKNMNNATASIRFNGTTFGFLPSPAVASFSSRGPSQMNGGVIKPDVLAPGVNILGAWHEDVGPNPNQLATNTFNFDSGTSMAAPHVAGIAALIKAKHPDWTPSMILSAIVTTANDSWTAGSPGGIIIDEISNDTAGIYTTGAGEVSPIKAMDPGLVFGLIFKDYVGYLCGLKYTKIDLARTVGKLVYCKDFKELSATELNYPSIAVNFTRSVTRQKATRTATNVGNASEEYQLKITEPQGVNIGLSSQTLKFTGVNQELSYEITFTMNGNYPSQGSDIIRRGKIVWYSDTHVVTTPIAVRFA